MHWRIEYVIRTHIDEMLTSVLEVVKDCSTEHRLICNLAVSSEIFRVQDTKQTLPFLKSGTCVFVWLTKCFLYTVSDGLVCK